MRELLQETADAVFVLSLTEVFNVVFAIALSIALGVVISQVYKQTHRGMNYELSFMSTLVLLAPIVTVVMLFIRGDLVLSLGLIGSLSIIRFRTPIKDTRDMVYLFWTIAIGLGAGTYNWAIVIIASLIMVPLVFVLYFSRYGRANDAEFVLVCAGEGEYPLAAIQDAVRRLLGDEASVRSHEVDGDSWETVFELRLPGAGASVVQQLMEEIKAFGGVQKVSLLAPKLDLPV